MTDRASLNADDVVVSKVEDGYLLLVVTADPSDKVSIAYRGVGWNVQYAVAKGAKLIANRGGDLWYTSDDLHTLEFLETFRRDPSTWRAHAEEAPQ